MNKNFKNAIAVLTLSAFCFGTGSVLAPAAALAAPHGGPGFHDRYHHGPNKLSKKDRRIVGVVVGVGALAAIIAGSIKHHKENKRY